MGKLIIIEDDKDTQIFLKFFLGKNYFLEFCDSEESFFECIKRASCDLIIMDVRLKGGEDGFELTKKLKGSAEYHSIPVLCLSAGIFDDYKQKAFNAGADYFLTKPVENRVLLNTIQMLLHKNGAYMTTAI